MTAEIVALRIAAADPERLAAFWSAVLGWRQDGERVVPDDDRGIVLRFVRREDPKTRLDRMHLDLASTSDDDQAETVRRALALGGSHFDVGQLPEELHVVLADPEGNEFCVVEASNSFLAGCGRVGALTGDGGRDVGLFWSRVLGWPLVWDEGEETAIQSPRGGPKIAWGGAASSPKDGPNRLQLEIRGVDVQRLLELGATRVDGAVLDPGGNELVLTEEGSP